MHINDMCSLRIKAMFVFSVIHASRKREAVSMWLCILARYLVQELNAGAVLTNLCSRLHCIADALSWWSSVRSCIVARYLVQELNAGAVLTNLCSHLHCIADTLPWWPSSLKLTNYCSLFLSTVLQEFKSDCFSIIFVIDKFKIKYVINSYWREQNKMSTFRI